MWAGLRILKPETVQWLRRELRRGELTRAALGRGLWEREQWSNRQGRLCAAAARKALPQLAAQLSLALPPAQAGPPRGRRQAAYPELGGAAGAHRGLAAIDAAALAWQRGLVAGLGTAADDGPRDTSSQSALARPGPAPCVKCDQALAEVASAEGH